MNIEEKRAVLVNYCIRQLCDESCIFRTEPCHFGGMKEEDIELAFDKLKLCKDINELEKSTDNVDHPTHYNSGKIEVIDYIEDQQLGFSLGNAVKYISRAGKKDKTKEAEDLKKAVWYIERRIKEIEQNEHN